MIIKQIKEKELTEFKNIYLINNINSSYKYFIKIAKIGSEVLYVPLVKEVKHFNDEYVFIIRRNNKNNLRNNYYINCYENIYATKENEKCFKLVGVLRECEINKLILTICAAITTDTLVKKNRIMLNTEGVYD